MAVDYGTCAVCKTAKLKKHGQTWCGPCHNAHRKRLKGNPAIDHSKPVDSFTAQGDTAEIGKMTPENVRTLADLVRVCQIDTDEWIVERWVANKWEVGTKNPADGTVTTTPLYQIKAWLKRNRPVLSAKEEIATLMADAKKGLPKLASTARTVDKSGLMLELNIADLHNGKLAWGTETGHGNYDSREAEALHDRAVETLLARCSGHKFERILIVLGNDLLHVDGRTNTTTAGTAQDMDSRYYKMFLATRRMATRMIDRARKSAPVHVAMVSGNHDRDSVWHLGDSLECYYNQCNDVTIDNAPTLRKYVEFGRVMLLFCHGDRSRREDYPLLMATEEPEMFGRTAFREAHTGHLHQTRVQEFRGVRVRILPALSGIDAWHSENGYVGNIRATEAFVWSAQEGLVGTAYYNAPVVSRSKKAS